MTTHYRVTLTIHTLEPGSHISRETISRRVFAEYVLPAADCEELRPDWGVYHPVATAQAAERRLRDMGAMPTLTRDEDCYIGIEDARKPAPYRCNNCGHTGGRSHYYVDTGAETLCVDCA